MTVIEEKQQAESNLRKGYRAAACRLNPNVFLSAHAHIQPCETGAFVEVHIWVPKEEGMADAQRLIAEAAEAEERRKKQQLANETGLQLTALDGTVYRPNT